MSNSVSAESYTVGAPAAVGRGEPLGFSQNHSDGGA